MCIFLKRFSAFVAALVLCFALCVPAFADDVSTSSFPFQFATPSSSFGKDVQSGKSSFIVPFETQSEGISFAYLTVPPDAVSTTGSIGVYFSFYYFSSATGARQNKVPSASDFHIYGYDLGGTLNSGTVSLKLFAPSASYTSMSDGVSLVGRISGSSGNPIERGINLSSGGWNAFWSDRNFTFVPVSGSFPAGDAGIYVTSFRVVSSGVSADLDALEDMASEIANQSQILSQFYGDIVAVCNQIYQRLGDLQAAQEEANSLFSNVISILNTTNGKLEAINMAMSTYFELLINQLKQEGIDTRTAIADAEARLEVFLKPMIDYFNELEEQTGESASTLPQHKQDINGFNNDGFGIEADGQTGLTAILPIFTAFSFILSVLGIFVGLGVLKIIIKKGLS